MSAIRHGRRLLAIGWLLIGLASPAAAATFGYTTVGGSQDFSAGLPKCTQFTSGGAGTITSVSVYVTTYFGGGANLATAVYADNAGAINALLASDSGHTAVTASAAWYTTNLSYVFAASTVYWLCEWFDSTNATSTYDAGAANQESYHSSLTFASWPNPFAPTASENRQYSIYATYTPSGAVTPPALTLLGVGAPGQ